MKPIRSDGVEFKPEDLILRSRVKHGVSKDRYWTLPKTVLRDAQERAPPDEARSAIVQNDGTVSNTVTEAMPWPYWK